MSYKARLVPNPDAAAQKADQGAWDTKWWFDNSAGSSRLPSRNLARHHGGWDKVEEAHLKRSSSPSSSDRAGVSGTESAQGDVTRTNEADEEAQAEKKSKDEEQRQQMAAAMATKPTIISSVVSDESEQQKSARPLYFPYPNVSLPQPELQFDFRLGVRFASAPAKMDLPGGGALEVGRVQTGSWSGALGSGTVVSGGHDLSRVRIQEARNQKVPFGAAMKLKTNDEDPAIIEMVIKACLDGTSDAMEALLDGAASDAGRKFKPLRVRMNVEMTSADKRYGAQVNTTRWIGSGSWRGQELLVDVYSLQ